MSITSGWAAYARATATPEQIDAIAREHGAKFVQAQLPDGYRHWFVAPNMGEPFDSGTARSVLSAIAYAGIRLGGAQ